jgi:hypothetical protein
MNRRFLNALQDHRYRDGAFATEWEGWKNPRERALNISGKINLSHPSRSLVIDDRVGCYVILYKTGAGTLYVAYVGYSAILGTELRRRINKWDIENSNFLITCIYIPNSRVAKEYEDDLIRFYCPPWNIRYTRQA